MAGEARAPLSVPPELRAGAVPSVPAEPLRGVNEDEGLGGAVGTCWSPGQLRCEWACGGDVSPGHPRVPRLPPEGSAPPGAVPAGDGSGAKLRTETPHVSGGSLLHLALIRKKSSPVLFQIWKRALQLSLDLGLGFRAASLRACHLRAKREPGSGSLPAASARAGRAGTLRGVPGLPWASGHRWTSSCSQAGAVQELEARTRCGSAPGPVEEELERSHLPWQRARGLAGARLGSWEQPLKPLALAL